MEVPEQLAGLRQWIVWRDEDGRKVPYQINGVKAKSNDPSTWSTLEEVEAVAESYSGIGFVFADGGGMWGMDLDGCRDKETGRLSEWAECIVNELKTYSEISPSGTGVKLWGLGRVGTGRKVVVNEEQVCAKKPAIEVYDHGRYFTFTGLRIGPLELRAADPLAIVKAYEYTPEVPRDDSHIRAAAYIDGVPGCGEGGRNQTAFRLAATLTNDFLLNDIDAWPLLCSWNGRNTPPLPDSELRSCFLSAKRNAKRPPGGKSDEPSTTPADPVGEQAAAAFVKSLGPLVIGAGKLGDIYKPPTDPGPFPPDCISDCLDAPGLIGEVMKYNIQTAMYPQPELALAGALSLLAVITGQKIRDERGTRTNIYTLGLAPTGSGKENARKVNKAILIQASSAGERMLGPERIGSHAGLVAAVAAQSAILFQIDEFGKMLATMRNANKSPHLFNIGTVLMQLYSSADTVWIADAYADLKKTKRIIQPHACVYGTGTPDDFWAGLTKENVTDGLLGRLLIFEGGYADNRKEPEQIDPPKSVLDRVRAWLELRPAGEGNLGDAALPRQLIVPLSTSARRRLNKHLDQICERRPSESNTAAAVWSRSGEKTAKLALLFACSRWDGNDSLTPIVEVEDVDRAVKIVNWLTRKMIRMSFDHVSENENEARAKRLLRLIDGEMTLTEIGRKSQWLRPRERMEILGDLQSLGYVMSEQKDTGGRPVTYYKRNS